MKQLTQTLRDGVMSINEVPIPGLRDKFVLVRNTASVISAGTEKTTVDIARKNIVQKAKARPDLVKQVLNKIRTDGVKKTLQTVSSRLDSPSPLGYSSAGNVIAAGGLVEGIQPGDRVACGGAGYANHAEIIAVPKNLVVKIPENVTDEEAAFTTLGSIVMQGIRLADPKLGETFLVLGLGLLGQICVQLLRANGCKVLATDLDELLVNRASSNGALAILPGDDITQNCFDLTGGRGVDGVLVCAGTSSNQPIELCGEVTREKGRVVVIGAVRMDIPREDYFKKEISVVISRSYGPGRYDPFYEEAGNDYPFGYVRFTEQRNMEAFLGIVAQGKVDIKNLISHRYPIDRAAEGYELIQGEKTEPYLGILLTYDNQCANANVDHQRLVTNSKKIDKTKLGISFYGAGNYATASLLPFLRNGGVADLRGLVTASGRTAQGVANRFDFAYCAAEFDELLGDDTDVVMITTRHDTHYSSVVSTIEAHKHAYVEKPLALSITELQLINEAVRSNPGQQVMVGFNRRFAPLTVAVIDHFAGVNSPLIVNIRINAGTIPNDHWIQDPTVGGGRIIGEACHFIDLASALTGSNPSTVYAAGTAKTNKSAMLNDNVSVTLTFENGSVANIIYVADGATAQEKELIEVHGGGRSAVIHDFKEATLFAGDLKSTRKKLPTQDKGQRAMLSAWLNGIGSGVPCVPHECLMKTSIATVMAVESMTIGAPLDIELNTLQAQ